MIQDTTLPARITQPAPPVPAALAAYGLQRVHVAPRCGAALKGPAPWSGRLPLSRAISMPFIDLQDAGSTWAAIVLDVDKRANLAALPDLPSPNIVIPTKRGAHCIWFLSAPVAKHDSAREAPIRFLKHVSEFMHGWLGADAGFTGLGRNPLHPDHADKTSWLRTQPHTLHGLHDCIPYSWKPAAVSVTPIGRNHDLFHAALRWAGQARNRGIPVAGVVKSLNSDIAAMHGKAPLPSSEVRSIIKSVERYRRQWERDGWHSRKFSARQAARGRLANDKTKQGRINRSAKGNVTNEADKPWLREGVSRATWYRRRAKARTRTPAGRVCACSNDSEAAS